MRLSCTDGLDQGPMNVAVIEGLGDGFCVRTADSALSLYGFRGGAWGSRGLRARISFLV